MAPTQARADCRRAALRSDESVGRKLNREVVLLLGWAPAVLQQLAHPLVAAGVADHSAFLARPGRRPQRLRRTVGAMLALAFGSADEVARAARAINAVHDRVHGRLREGAGPFPAGTPYTARDPALLRWVHATLLDTLPRAYALFVGPLTPEERDRYCAEASGVAPLLGIPDGYLPTSQAALEDYLRGMYTSGAIVVTDTARRVAREVVAPSTGRLTRPLLSLTYLPTVGLLPPALRRAYGLPWDARHERALRLLGGATRMAVPRLPTALRHWPAARRAAGQAPCHNSESTAANL